MRNYTSAIDEYCLATLVALGLHIAYMMRAVTARDAVLYILVPDYLYLDIWRLDFAVPVVLCDVIVKVLRAPGHDRPKPPPQQHLTSCADCGRKSGISPIALPRSSPEGLMSGLM